MKRTALIVTALLALASSGAFATTCKNGGTNWPTCTTPSTPSPGPSTSTSSSQSSSASNASAGSQSSAVANVAPSTTSTSTASGGSVGAVSQSFEEFSRSNMYVLPAPVQAAPLPPGLCPQGDSMSIGILWNMFSYSRSSTRTEMECLDKVLASIRSAPTREVVQAPLSLTTAPAPAVLPAPASPALAAAAADPAAASASGPVKKPEAAKAPAKKASAPKKAAPKA